MSVDAQLTKPASGYWTDAYPELGRGPVSLEDCVSEEFYEKEREHVFKKTWLYMGRVERVPKSGSYFTRELRFLNTSIIIVRGKDGVIRAFHNICPHRGNKMLWSDDPFEEVQGRAPVLYCRFHGWRYNLDGSLHAPTRKDLLLDFDADSCRVPAIQCEVWEGFIFVNLNPDNREPLRSFLGELAHGIEGYPFAGPHQVYRFKAELQCNWKIFVDGFAESYHGPYLHASSFGALTAEARDAFDQPNPFTDALALAAMKTIWRELPTSFHQPGNAPAREAMMLAATQAGIAFSNASVALVHGMSRPLGAHFHIPHGLSNAMLLPAVTAFSVDAALDRYAECARTMGVAQAHDTDQSAVDQLIHGLYKRNAELQVPSPKQFGIAEEEYFALLGTMAAQALASGSPQNNPRIPSAEEIEAIYRQAWQ